MPNSPEIRKAAMILSALALTEGAWVILNLRANPRGFIRYVGLLELPSEPLGMVFAIAIFVAFTIFASRLPSVRSNLFRLSGLKALGLAVAVMAGFCEEAIFRKLLMDALAHREYNVITQMLTSAVAFGAAHGIWGAFRGSFAAAIGAMATTGALGLALAGVYIISQRVLAPCIVSHLLINVLVEPGLVLAAVRGEMGRQYQRSPSRNS